MQQSEVDQVVDALTTLNNNYGKGYVRSVSIQQQTFWQQPYGTAGYTKHFRLTMTDKTTTVKALGHQRTFKRVQYDS